MKRETISKTVNAMDPMVAGMQTHPRTRVELRANALLEGVILSKRT